MSGSLDIVSSRLEGARRSSRKDVGLARPSQQPFGGGAMDDVEEIKKLKARYCRLMDTKDWAGYRQVFTDDVTMDTTDSGGGVITGADEFLEFLVPTI